MSKWESHGVQSLVLGNPAIHFLIHNDKIALIDYCHAIRVTRIKLFCPLRNTAFISLRFLNHFAIKERRNLHLWDGCVCSSPVILRVARQGLTGIQRDAGSTELYLCWMRGIRRLWLPLEKFKCFGRTEMTAAISTRGSFSLWGNVSCEHYIYTIPVSFSQQFQFLCDEKHLKETIQ